VTRTPSCVMARSPPGTPPVRGHTARAAAHLALVLEHAGRFRRRRAGAAAGGVRRRVLHGRGRRPGRRSDGPRGGSSTACSAILARWRQPALAVADALVVRRPRPRRAGRRRSVEVLETAGPPRLLALALSNMSRCPCWPTAAPRASTSASAPLPWPGAPGTRASHLAYPDQHRDGAVVPRRPAARSTLDEALRIACGRAKPRMPAGLREPHLEPARLVPAWTRPRVT